MKKEPKKDINSKQKEYLERLEKAMENFKDLYKSKDNKDPLEEWR